MGSRFDILLDWKRDSKGYELYEHRRGERRIVARGAAVISIAPLKVPLFAEFANVKTEIDLVKFMNRNGYLQAGSHRGADLFRMVVDADGKVEDHVPTGETVYGENVEDHLLLAGLFRRILKRAGATRPPSGKEIEELLDMLGVDDLATLEIEPDQRRGFRTVIRPTSLAQGMAMQLMFSMDGRSDFKVCELLTCGKVFAVGPAKRRRVSRFCSDRHRITYNSLARAT